MESKKWLNYWRKSLLDSLKADIDIEKTKYFEVVKFNIENPFLENLLEVNKLIDLEEIRINKKKDIVDNKHKDWQKLKHVQLLIAPFKIVQKKDRQYISKGQTMFPFWYCATVNRDGELTIPESIYPVFQRQYLEPVAKEDAEFVFSTIETVDKALSIGKEEYSSFKDYISYVKDVFKQIKECDLDSYQLKDFDVVANAIVLIPDEDNGASESIIKLYGKILTEHTLPRLLKIITTLDNRNEKLPISDADMINANALHFGQMGYEFSLSISQRKSLYTFLSSDSTVFAVNGPPGTGKTTLLQSVVANSMVESAIKGGDPKIILACSTNNQAVTNIIDSFSTSNTREGNLQGRWLPEIEGYATYLPAQGKDDDELKGKNYKKQQDDTGLFSKVEELGYLEAGTKHYCSKSSQYFASSNLDIKQSINKLRNEIVRIESSLHESTQLWKAYLKAELLFQSDYLTANTSNVNYYINGIIDEASLMADIDSLMKLEQRILSYFKQEPFFRSLFCFLGIKCAIRDRSSKIRIILRDSLIVETENFVFKQSSILEIIDRKIRIGRLIIKDLSAWNGWKHRNSIIGNPSNYSEDNYRGKNYFYDELDITLRHKAFQLALHYWEGRWLLKLGDDLFDDTFQKKGVVAVKNRWIRQSMLTPCFVSTFYMAPKFFSYTPKLKMDANKKLIDDRNPLFDFIDLLIVDEAGQVSPEVGVATFALAKKAIVIGDIKQIEPVWNISRKVDHGNLKECEIIKDYDDKDIEYLLDVKGFLSSCGSIMKMAQNACSFKEKDLSEKGVILVEHRRCFDEIINYCNELAYSNKLVPLKGNPKTGELLFPPMYCIHVDGNSVVTKTSRYNPNEIAAIVDWLKTNKSIIEAKYAKPIESVVGIITPFVGQKDGIRMGLKKAGFNINAMKIGTVHALQGAERSIVLFSMVYGAEDKGTKFFDRDNKPNMLNVAVSRAKDNFIVFANTAILNPKLKTPSGILAKHLKYEDIVVETI